MGDADSEVVLSAQQNEDWTVEALGYVDERMENLLLLVTNLHERTNEITLELKTLKIYRNIFLALNFLIVPVVLAIMICYGTKASFSVNSHGIEAILQRLVMLFMLLSTLSLPMYIMTIWKSFSTSVDINEEPNDQSLDDLLIALTRSLSDEFARFLQNPARMPSKFRRDLLRVRENQQWGINDSFEQRQLLGMEDSLETVMDLAVIDASDSVEPSKRKHDEYPNGPEEEPEEVEFPIRYRFKLRMDENSPDLALKFKPSNRKERIETTEDGKMVEENAIESHVDSPSAAENDEEMNTSTAVASPELHTCKNDFFSVENQLQTPEISC